MDMSVIIASVTGSSMCGLLVFLLYRALRPYFDIKVNCWFCQKDTRVGYVQREGWDCPHCDQYNGFTKDGGYNKIIDAQRDESLNQSVSSAHNSSPDLTVKSNGLCTTCNENQLLKVKQLAFFVPFNEDDFDEEVEMYRQHLEYVYRLCVVCQRRVNATLSSQDAILRQKAETSGYYQTRQDTPSSHTSASRSRVVSGPEVCTPLHISFLRVTAFMCASSLLVISILDQLEDSPLDVNLYLYIPKVILTYIKVMSATQKSLTYIGLLSSYISILLFGKHGLLGTDPTAAFSWIGILLAVSDSFEDTLEDENILLLKTLLTLLCTVACLLNCIRKRNSSTPTLRIRRISLSRSSSALSTPRENTSQQNGIHHNQKGTVQQNGIHRNQPTDGASASRSDPSPNEEHQEADPIVPHVDRLSLGPPSRTRKNRTRGTFDWFNNLHSNNSPSSPSFATSSSAGHLSPQQRPLISPARFVYGQLSNPNKITNPDDPPISRNLFPSQNEQDEESSSKVSSDLSQPQRRLINKGFIIGSISVVLNVVLLTHLIYIYL